MKPREAIHIARWSKNHLVRREELEEAKKCLRVILSDIQRSLDILHESENST